MNGKKLSDELEEGEIEIFKPGRMYELNQKNLQKDKKALQYIKETEENLSKVLNQPSSEKSAKDLKAELIV